MVYFGQRWHLFGTTLWILITRVLPYNVRRIENASGEPLNFEIDFLSEEDRDRFFRDLTNVNDSLPFDGPTTSEPTSPNQTGMRNIYFIHNSELFPEVSNEPNTLDSWSVVWYIASFGGLIVFFLLVSCSEWCCRRARRRNNASDCNRQSSVTLPTPDTPPPSYDQFAPPSYESICLGRNGSEKAKYDIFVVPVHTIRHITAEDAPPPYPSAENFVPALARLDAQVT